MTDNPQTTPNLWVPHQRGTWPWRVATLKQAVTMRFYQGYWKDGHPAMTEREVPAGAKVKVVMVSRFGDVGITDDLSADTGYGARVPFDTLEPCSV